MLNSFVRYLEDPKLRRWKARKNEDNDSESKERAEGLYLEVDRQYGGGAVFKRLVINGPLEAFGAVWVAFSHS